VCDSNRSLVACIELQAGCGLGEAGLKKTKSAQPEWSVRPPSRNSQGCWQLGSLPGMWYAKLLCGEQLRRHLQHLARFQEDLSLFLGWTTVRLSWLDFAVYSCIFWEAAHANFTSSQLFVQWAPWFLHISQNILDWETIMISSHRGLISLRLSRIPRSEWRRLQAIWSPCTQAGRSPSWRLPSHQLRVSYYDARTWYTWKILSADSYPSAGESRAKSPAFPLEPSWLWLASWWVMACMECTQPTWNEGVNCSACICCLPTLGSGMATILHDLVQSDSRGEMVHSHKLGSSSPGAVWPLQKLCVYNITVTHAPQGWRMSMSVAAPFSFRIGILRLDIWISCIISTVQKLYSGTDWALGEVTCLHASH
jgi:hypothetical protein